MKLNLFEFWLVNNPIRAWIQEHYELSILQDMLAGRTFDSVLEIGCGRGLGAKLIKKYFHSRRVTAIDLDPKMIAIAQKEISDPSITFQVMDATRLQFPDNSFDAVFDFGIIHHIPNWQDCIREVKRVLHENGSLVVDEIALESFTGFPGALYRRLMTHPYEQMFTIGEFVNYLDVAGFAVIKFQEFNPFKMIRHFCLVARA